MKFKLSLPLLSLVLLTLWQCKPATEEEKSETLPILGNWHVNDIEIEGKTLKDTVYHKIADFKFVNQDGDTISNSSVAGKVYVADFFFTTCPTICPIMTENMGYLQEQFREDDEILLLSHSVTPVRDSVAQLNILINPGAIANPWASISSIPLASVVDSFPFKT